MPARDYPNIGYTFRNAENKDIPKLLALHNTPENLQSVFERTEASLQDPIHRENLYLIERDTDKKLFGMCGMFEMAPGYMMHGALVDHMRNSGADSLQRLSVEIGTLNHALQSQREKQPLGVLYARILRGNQYLRAIQTSLAGCGFCETAPDDTMRDIAQRLVSDPTRADAVILKFDETVLPLLAYRVLARGEHALTTSRRLQERQAITLDVPVVRDREFLASVACRDPALAAALSGMVSPVSMR